MLIFLKLGGSLITDKDKPLTPRTDIIREIAKTIKKELITYPDLKIILGHGSGSFGHSVAKKFQTIHGVKDEREWMGYIKVWEAARSLNQIVIEQFQAEGIPVLTISPSSTVQASDQQITIWETGTIGSALKANLVPVIHGDVVFDAQIGGTILSTEKLFYYLADQFQPSKIILAGIEEGVWNDYPNCTEIIQKITPDTFSQLSKSISGSASVDVTGGMLDKVSQMVSLVEKKKEIEIQIISGLVPGNISKSFAGIPTGTLISHS